LVGADDLVTFTVAGEDREGLAIYGSIYGVLEGLGAALTQREGVVAVS
jgi:hypothetical protein